MTDIVLDQHAPGGVMKQMGDAAGGIAYNQYAPGGCMGQLHEASGLDEPYNQYASGGAFGQLEEELEGGGAPDWVPVNAVIHIDLVGGDPQGRAWANGAEVAVDTLLGSDANTSNMWSDTEYDPTGLTADGYVYTGTSNAYPPAFIGSLRDTFIAGGTLAVTFKQIEASSQPMTIMAGAANGNDAVKVDFLVVGNGLKATSFSGTLDLSGTSVGSTGLGAINREAVTLVEDRLDMSANGEAGVTAVFDADDRPSDNLFVAAMLITESATQSITLYDPLPSTAGLSELSEV